MKSPSHAAYLVISLQRARLESNDRKRRRRRALKARYARTRTQASGSDWSLVRVITAAMLSSARVPVCRQSDVRLDCTSISTSRPAIGRTPSTIAS